MRDDQMPNGTTPLVVASISEETTVTPLCADDDAALLMLEVQFNALTAELTAAQRTNREIYRGQRSSGLRGVRTGVDDPRDHDVRTRQVEAVLARLHPLEHAIMTIPARTIAGLGVKARHAAYVVSQYWSEPIDKIDWEARAVRLLIEAVCKFDNNPSC
jgi:hypothetical protein